MRVCHPAPEINGLELAAWLTGVLAKLPTRFKSRIDELLPLGKMGIPAVAR